MLIAEVRNIICRIDGVQSSWQSAPSFLGGIRLRVVIAFLASLMMIATAVAQSSDDAYWNEPGPVIKDSAGKVTYEEIRDPQTFTVRVFVNGVWFMQHYQPHTHQLLRTDAPDTTEEPVYEQGKMVGMRIRADALTFTVHSEHDAFLGLPGLDPISIEKDLTARVTAIHTASGKQLAAFRFDDSGSLRVATFGTASLEIGVPAADGTVNETLTATGGKVIASRTVRGDQLGAHGVAGCLDPVRSILGLSDDWVNSLSFKRSATGTLTSVADRGGRSVLYIVNYGSNQFGFDPTGKPLFVDARVDLVGGSIAADSDKSAIAMQKIIAVVPSHVVVTADGRVGACVDRPASGAIASLWTEVGPNGHELVRYRTIGSAASSKKMAPSAQSKPHVRLLLPAPQYFYVCDTTTVDTTDSITGQTVSTTTDYYCSSTDSGSSGTGGGGGGIASNQISGDATLSNQVTQAVSTAQQKLNKCASQLLALLAANSTAANKVTLGDWLNAKNGSTMPFFLSSGAGETFVMDTTSNPNGICAAGYPAYTFLYQNTTYICENQFKALTSFDQWVRLIHEELHCLGYPEYSSTFPNAQTPQQISQMVEQLCN